MIVPAMTEQEICKELLDDMSSLYSKAEACRKKFRSLVLRSSRFPVSRSYECKTVKKKNIVVITYVALKRGKHDDPSMGLHSIYERPEGKYLARFTFGGRITIFPPHFFDRYQERVLNGTSMPRNEVIKRYIRNNSGQVSVEIDDHLESVFKCFEGHYSDEVINYVSATSEGYCFGEYHGKVSIVKTIITENMVSDRQEDLFHALRELFVQNNMELYGSDWIRSSELP